MDSIITMPKFSIWALFTCDHCGLVYGDEENMQKHIIKDHDDKTKGITMQEYGTQYHSVEFLRIDNGDFIDNKEIVEYFQRLLDK